jgi:hypothetical protein
MPANTPVWVSSLFVDPIDKRVLTKRLNVRAGPSENYSVVGLLEQGAVIKEISTKGDWLEIELPSNAYAFVAADRLTKRIRTAPGPPSRPPAANRRRNAKHGNTRPPPPATRKKYRSRKWPFRPVPEPPIATPPAKIRLCPKRPGYTQRSASANRVDADADSASGKRFASRRFRWHGHIKRRPIELKISNPALIDYLHTTSTNIS